MKKYGFFGVVAFLAAISCDQATPEKKMAIYGDPGPAIRAKVGEEFGIAAADNPTWSPDSRMQLGTGLPSCVSLASSRSDPSDPGNRAPGGGAGTRVWVLKAIQPGEGKVVLTTRARKENGTGPEDRVFTVIVTGP
jgi:predicted secreted protein